MILEFKNKLKILRLEKQCQDLFVDMSFKRNHNYRITVVNIERQMFLDK